MGSKAGVSRTGNKRLSALYMETVCHGYFPVNMQLKSFA